jgi:hypothetical protein
MKFKFWHSDVPTEQETSQSTEEATIAYSSDAPLQDPKLDRFDREPFARRIAETLARRQDSSSMVLAIYGPWGDGKTTVLNFIRSFLSKDNSVIHINFNPWRLEGEEALLTGFFSTLADALDAELKSKTQKIGDLLKAYSFLLKPVPVAGRFEGIAAGAGSIMSSVSLDKLRKQISSILCASRRRVVVVIDDIDRLEKGEIQSIFRLVKLTADFDNVSYVLAFDEEMVTAALGERYSSDASQYRAAGAKFLEKIVQVGLNLPPAGIHELRDYAFEQINEALRISRVDLSRQDAAEFSRNFVVGLAPRLTTPRMAKRYGNSLQFSLGILQGEIRTSDLMMIEGIRTFYPQFYLAIRDNKDLVLKRERDDKFNILEFIRKNNPSLLKDEETGLGDALQSLFPRTKTSIYPSDWDIQWSREKRICSSEYFDRYFSYAIRANDVSDHTLGELLNSEELSDRDYLTAFDSLISTKNASVFISKLRERENSLSSTATRRISIALASKSSCLPSSQGIWGVTQPFSQAAMFLAQALKRIPQEERLEFAKDVFTACELPTFVAECMRWMSVNGENEPKILEAEQEQKMRHFGGETILTFLEQEKLPIFVVATSDAADILNSVRWGLGDEKAREYVAKCLEKEPNSAVSLIRAFKGRATSMETGLEVESRFFGQQYNAIVALADRNDIAAALAKTYGEALAGSSDNPPDDDSDLRLARQFMTMVKNAIEREALQAQNNQ